jgi:hypothetical protein
MLVDFPCARLAGLNARLLIRSRWCPHANSCGTRRRVEVDVRRLSAREVERTGELFKAFERVTDYDTYVDGKPRADGTQSFLQSRDIELPEAKVDDETESETVHGPGNRENGILLRRLREAGVTVFPGSLRYLRVKGAPGLHDWC